MGKQPIHLVLCCLSLHGIVWLLLGISSLVQHDYTTLMVELQLFFMALFAAQDILCGDMERVGLFYTDLCLSNLVLHFLCGGFRVNPWPFCSLLILPSVSVMFPRLYDERFQRGTGNTLPLVCAALAVLGEIWIAPQNAANRSHLFFILQATEIPMVLFILVRKFTESQEPIPPRSVDIENDILLNQLHVQLSQAWQALDALQCSLQLVSGAQTHRVSRGVREVLGAMDKVSLASMRGFVHPVDLLNPAFEPDSPHTVHSCLKSALDAFVHKHNNLGRTVELTLPEEGEEAMGAVIRWSFRFSVSVLECLDLSSSLVSPFHPLTISIIAKQENGTLVLTLCTDHKSLARPHDHELAQLHRLLDRMGGVLIEGYHDEAVEFTMRLNLKPPDSLELDEDDGGVDCATRLAQLQRTLHTWYDGGSEGSSEATSEGEGEGEGDGTDEGGGQAVLAPMPPLRPPRRVSPEYSLRDTPYVDNSPIHSARTSLSRSPLGSPLMKPSFSADFHREVGLSPTVRPAVPRLRIDPHRTQQRVSGTPRHADDEAHSGASSDAESSRRDKPASLLTSRALSGRRSSTFTLQLRKLEESVVCTGPSGSPERTPQSSRVDPRRVSILRAEDPLAAGSGYSSPTSTHSPSAAALGNCVFGRKSFVLHQEKQGLIRWRKGRLLGSGAFGDVYIGLDEIAGEMFAVKVVKFDVNDPRVREKASMLQTEIHMLQKLRHTNVVGYIGVQREGNTMNIFQQYVAGGSVATLLGQFGAFGEDVTAVYTKQTTEGLAYLHENQVVHRDIKGGNVLVDIDGTVKLADFGSAATLTDMSQAKDIKGTPFWMAPEVIRGEEAGFKADIWSLGCTVMEMLTAKRPFASTVMSFAHLCNLYNSPSDEPMPLPSDLPPTVVTFLTVCLARNPDNRPQARDLLRQPFLDGVQPAHGMDAVQDVLQWHNEWVAFLAEHDRDGELNGLFEEWSMRQQALYKSESIDSESPLIDVDTMLDEPPPVVEVQEPEEPAEFSTKPVFDDRTLSSPCGSPKGRYRRPQKGEVDPRSFSSIPAMLVTSPSRQASAVDSLCDRRTSVGSNGEEVPQRKATVQVPNSYLQYLEVKHMKAVRSVNAPLLAALRIQRAWRRHRAPQPPPMPPPPPPPPPPPQVQLPDAEPAPRPTTPPLSSPVQRRESSGESYVPPIIKPTLHRRRRGALCQEDLQAQLQALSSRTREDA